jgi:hypothetical protein
MNSSVFAELWFWLMMLASVVLPVVIYGVLLAKRAVSPITVLVLGLVLVAIAGLDVYFLRHLAAIAKVTASASDDAFFASEVSLALYLLPVLFGGVGVNLVSDVLIGHLRNAEKRFAEEHRDKRR